MEEQIGAERAKVKEIALLEALSCKLGLFKKSMCNCYILNG